MRLDRWCREMLWQRRMRRLYAQFIQPGDLAFDVGAHLGSRTRVFLELGATVVAVEPQKECARRLFYTFYTYPYFHLVNKALGAAEGTGELFVSNFTQIATLSREWIATSRPGEGRDFCWPASRQVTVSTLDALIGEYGVPRFVKIDTEGFDDEVVRGLSRPLAALSFEFLTAFLVPALRCIDHLSRLGPMSLNYTCGESFRWMQREWVGAEVMVRLLEGHRGTTRFSHGDVYVRFTGDGVR